MSTLTLDDAEMRRVGYAVVDWLIGQLGSLHDQPVLRQTTATDLRSRLSEPPPEAGVPMDQLLERLATDVLPYSAIWGHPRFFGYIPASGTWPGALADFIAAACNLDSSTWREAGGLTMLELVVIDWMKDWLGYPASAEGLLVSGGSAANLTAMACARHAALGEMDPGGVVYVSDQAHSSLARAARVLGFRSDQVRVLATDARFRMRPDLLERAVAADLAAGRKPVMVVAAAGSTNTGAVDPFPELADVCTRHQIWLHVDAAYGGFAMLTEAGRRLMTGIEEADSITVDPHKWLYQPFECGALLVRRPGALADAFRITPPYLEDADDAEETNFANLGLQLSRGSRSLKVWMSVSNLGLSAFRQTIEESMRLAKHLERRIETDDRFELLSRAELSVVCFRRVAAGAGEAELEELNAGLLAELIDSGEALISSTRLAGRYSLRMCVFNPSTTVADVDSVFDFLAAATPATDRRSAGVLDQVARTGWIDGDTETMVRRHPMFENIDPSVVDRLLAAGQEAIAPGRWRIIEEMDTDNTVYLILGGRVEVTLDQRTIASLGAGSFFGEMAAVDWGAGFGSPRMAAVTAIADTHMFSIPATVLNQAMRSTPELRRRVETVLAARAAELRDAGG